MSGKSCGFQAGKGPSAGEFCGAASIPLSCTCPHPRPATEAEVGNSTPGVTATWEELPWGLGCDTQVPFLTWDQRQ